jgi:hypothetical protein
MSFKYGLVALVAVLGLGAGMLSVGTASADRGVMPPSYVALDDGGGIDPRGPGDLTGVVGQEQACEQGRTSTTCVWKGWLMAGVCLTFGGEIAAGDLGGVFICEFPKD